jgi:hypothetical protein
MRTEVSGNLTTKQIHIYQNAWSFIPGDSILHCMKCVGMNLRVEHFFNVRVSMDIIFGLFYKQAIYTYTHNSKHPFVCLSHSVSLKRYIFRRNYVNLKYCYFFLVLTGFVSKSVHFHILSFLSSSLESISEKNRISQSSNDFSRVN